MAELFKDLYSEKFFALLSEALNEVLIDFNQEQFIAEIYDTDWHDKEFKQRVHHVSFVLKTYLSDSFPEAVEQLHALIAVLKTKGLEKHVKYVDLVLIFVPDYIEQNGLNDFETSVVAFEQITPTTTCEFAVRPFIIKYEHLMLNRMMTWTKSKNKHLRRLASEGCRSRLPWGMAIQAFKHNPSPVLPILDALKNDASEYVRKSVANNLNDISKDNPQIVIDIAKQWKGQSKETDWIVKHACRTLLKAGNTEILQLFGFASPDDVEINDLQVEQDSISVGEDLLFHFTLNNVSEHEILLRLEYAIYYQKKNGSLSKKVYKISEKKYAPNSLSNISRKQSFKQISSRTFHAGEHVLSLIVNGIEMEERTFELKL